MKLGMSDSVAIAIGYMAYLILLIGVCASKNYKITKVWYFFALLFVLSLANMAYHLVPNKSLDVYRLLKVVDEMRSSQRSALSLILEGAGDQYGGLITFNLLCYIVSIIGNQWLPTISVLVTGSLLLYVIVTFLMSKEYPCIALLPAICMTFMGLQVHYIFSGIRNGMAVSMTVFALYQMYRYNRVIISSVIIYAFAIMMHPVVVIVAPVLCIAVYGKYQKIYRMIALLAIPIIFAVAQVLTTIPNTLLQYIGNRTYYYENHNYAADRPEMIANIAMFFAIGLGYWWLHRENCFERQSTTEAAYTNFYYLMGFVMVGCVMKRDFINRIGYVMGILSVPLLCQIFWGIKKNKLTQNVKVIRGALALSIVACCGKVFYDTLYVLTRWSFE